MGQKKFENKLMIKNDKSNFLNSPAQNYLKKIKTSTESNFKSFILK